MLSIAITQERVEAALAAGDLACPACSGRLSPWGFARSREVRMRDGARWVTPRRARCGSCETTHVLSPSWLVPRRRDGAEVIGEALRLAAGGDGHRVIARQLGRPEGGPWVAACRPRTRREPAGVRDPTAGLARPGTRCRHPGRQRLGRRGRGDHARCPGVGAAFRPRRPRPLGTRGVANRRAAARTPPAPAVAPPLCAEAVVRAEHPPLPPLRCRPFSVACSLHARRRRRGFGRQAP
jgi:Domain of unknown function (DUF6431)